MRPIARQSVEEQLPKPVQAVDTTGNFAGCIETRNGFAGLRADHLSLIVNADAAHAVVKFRPESHRIERSLEFNSLIQGTAEELVFTCATILFHSAICCFSGSSGAP